MGEILSVSEHPTPPPKPLPRFPSGSVPLKKEKKNGDGETDTLCCETLIATAAVCLQLKREQCRSCESVCVCLRAHL